jgi:hypothetical protein
MSPQATATSTPSTPNARHSTLFGEEALRINSDEGGGDDEAYQRLGERYLSKTGDSRQVVADSTAHYFGLVLNDESLTPGANPRLGSTTFEEWFSTSHPK